MWTLQAALMENKLLVCPQSTPLQQINNTFRRRNICPVKKLKTFKKKKKSQNASVKLLHLVLYQKQLAALKLTHCPTLECLSRRLSTNIIPWTVSSWQFPLRTELEEEEALNPGTYLPHSPVNLSWGRRRLDWSRESDCFGGISSSHDLEAHLTKCQVVNFISI